MALDIQQRPAQHGHRRGHTCYETENGRVVLQADPTQNGGITIGRYLRPRRDLINLAGRLGTAGAVAAELKFAFWQHLFVTAQDPRLWEPHLRTAFPGIPAAMSVATARQQIHDDIQAIRSLRNRIAHHEPIIARALTDDLDRAHRLATWRRPMLGTWLQQTNNVAQLLNDRP